MTLTRTSLSFALLVSAACAVDSRAFNENNSSLTPFGDGAGNGGGTNNGGTAGEPPSTAGSAGSSSGSGGSNGFNELPPDPDLDPIADEPDAAPTDTDPDPDPDPDPEDIPPSPSSDLPAPPVTGIARPAGAVANLRVLPWAGFRAAVSYTFDDANSSQIQNYAALQNLAVPYTFYLQTNKPDAQNQVWAQAVRDGHELGNHTQSHQSTGANIGADTDAASNFIESRFGVTVRTMAAPNGSTAYGPIASTRFLINRGVNDQQISVRGTADPYNLPCYIPPTGTSTDTFNGKVNAVRTAGNWQVVLVHGFTGGNDGAFQPVELAQFTASVQYTKSLGDIWIDTVVDVAAYWLGQRLLGGVTPTSAAGVTTWNWSLPALFPPGQFLRVVVDGGTLRQGSTVLTWDEHGYYEVDLDAGTLSLSP